LCRRCSLWGLINNNNEDDNIDDDDNNKIIFAEKADGEGANVSKTFKNRILLPFLTLLLPTVDLATPYGDDPDYSELAD